MSALLSLYEHLHPDDATPADADRIFEQFQSYAGSAVLIGWAGETAVASCTLVVIPNLTRGGRPFGLIENVVTHSAHRNRGFAKAVLLAATERAWEADCYKVMLLTGAADPTAHALYHSAGFSQSKTGYQMRRDAVREG